MQATTKKKRRWPFVLLSIIVVAIVLIAPIVLTSLYISTPTKGESISAYDNPKSALLVIDVQNDTTGNMAIYGDTAGFVEKVNQAIATAEQNGMEIIYIKNVYGGNPLISFLSHGKYREGTNGAELDGNLYVVNENIFSKAIGDSFSSRDFEEYLISREIDTLYIVGADAAACVLSTARGGINRNYSVNIIDDAIITINDAIMASMAKQYHSLGIETLDVTRFEDVLSKK